MHRILPAARVLLVVATVALSVPASAPADSAAKSKGPVAHIALGVMDSHAHASDRHTAVKRHRRHRGAGSPRVAELIFNS